MHCNYYCICTECIPGLRMYAVTSLIFFFGGGEGVSLHDLAWYKSDDEGGW
jgi:hypothetical protein